MSREIKFRAYIEGTMYFDIYVGENRMVQLAYYELGLSGSLEGVMQYTGLLDKDGVEIYEGDIVQNEHAIKFEITWSKTDFGFKARLHKTILECDLKQDVFEVIGNVHESPELLK